VLAYACEITFVLTFGVNFLKMLINCGQTLPAMIESAILNTMIDPLFKPKLPEIAERNQTSVVRSLLQIIGQQQEQIQWLEDEIRWLQGGPPRPQLKPNTLEPVGPAGAAESCAGLARG
jgi:hypothetical protein